METEDFDKPWKGYVHPELGDAIVRLCTTVASSPTLIDGVRPRALVIGGFVRDSLLGIAPKDADVEVVGVSPERLADLLRTAFPSVYAVGRSFGVCKIPLGGGVEIDVSTPTHDSLALPGQGRGMITGDPRMGVREAARRRDFTINALTLDPLLARIADPFGGLADLAARILRVTDPQRFRDDALRVLRAAQFVARYRLSIESQTFDLMRTMVAAGELDSLPSERVTQEWVKLLAIAHTPSRGLELLRALGLLERHHPELQALIGVPQDPQWHPEGDVWIHTMMVVDEAAGILRRDPTAFTREERLAIAFGALLHDVGKPATTCFEDGRIRARGHEEAGEAPARAFLGRFTLPEAVVEGAVAITTQHLKPGVMHGQLLDGHLTPKSYANATRKLLRRIAPTPVEVLLAASEADARGRTTPDAKPVPYLPAVAMRAVIAESALEKAAARPLLGGRDILAWCASKGRSAEPGPWVGECIARIERERDAGLVDTREGALALLEADPERYLG